MCIYVYVYEYFLCVYMHVYDCLCVYECLYVDVYVYMSVGVYYVNACVWKSSFVCVYMRLCTCV